jgi:predicted lipoprotein with Yx(FWY)xxD motif
VRMTRSPFKRVGLASAGVAALTMVAAACGANGGSGNSPYYGAGDPRQPFAAGPPTPVSSTTSALGPILVDGSGRTLYLFAADHPDKSACTSACAAIWPPYAPPSRPQAGTGVDGVKLGAITRADGAKQVSYDGHPLYYYVGDGMPGQTTGQALSQFGAAWYVVARCGSAITTRQR